MSLQRSIVVGTSIASCLVVGTLLGAAPAASAHLHYVGTTLRADQPDVSIVSYTGPTVHNPDSIAVGSDGALWFTNGGGASIGRITTSGAITDFVNGGQINEPTGIASGSDGALWFTNYPLNTIGRITTSGVVSSYPMDGGYPKGITAGPDGALWFTTQTGGIGRMTTNGGETDYGGVGIDDPQEITTGPDGALWFTNLLNNSIGRITTSGVVSNYTAPGINNPDGITAGSDGALWFTNQVGNSIGRISTSGVVTIYTDQSIDQPGAITTGPDGALWFTNVGNDSIGRITTSGVVSNFTSANIAFTDELPTGITLGPDGNLWFTDGGSAIGEVVFPTSAPTISGTPTSPITQEGPYYFQLAMTGVPSPTATLQSGSLPPGLNLSPDGVISGDPTTIGTYTATVVADNGVSPSGSDTFTIQANPTPPGISGNPPDRASVASPYTFQFTLSGFPPPTVSVTAGALPPGLTLASDGLLSGTPTEAGRYKATLTATNGYAPDATVSIELHVKLTIGISPTSGRPHTLLSVSGAGYVPGETVLVTYVYFKSITFPVCSGVAQSDGTFSCSGKIPGRKNAGGAGVHEVIATGQAGHARYGFRIKTGRSS